MTWRRDVLVERIRHAAAAEDATGDWPADVVLDLASTVHQQEWGHLLDASPRLRLARRVVTVTADGTVPLAAFDAPLERFERVMVLRLGTWTLQDLATSWAGRLDGVRWERVGDALVVDAAPGATLSALVTHLPPLLRDLPLPAPGADGTQPEPEVPFPDGWEWVLAYETAAHLLDKGARESDAAMRLEQKAEIMRQRMLARLQRVSTTPMAVAAIDEATDWGSW